MKTQPLKLPLLILNFKTYPQTTGKNALQRARLCKQLQRPSFSLLVAPSQTDLRSVSQTGIKTLAQHIDPLEPGRNTGSITAEMVRSTGAIGTFINHSEKKLSFLEIKKCIALAKSNGLLSFCFAATQKELVRIGRLKPDFVVFEPPELIATRSVTEASPQLVKNAVQAIQKIDVRLPVLCGAGIATQKDVQTSLCLGAKGVALASAFAKAKKPKQVLQQLVNAFG